MPVLVLPFLMRRVFGAVSRRRGLLAAIVAAGLCAVPSVFAEVVATGPAPAPSPDTSVALPDIRTALAEVRAVADTGATGLALHLLDQAQARGSNANTWMALERERVRLLTESGRWDALADRVAAFPADIPADFLHWARRHRAEALLRSARPAQARAVLLQLLVLKPPAGELARLRRDIAQTYLAEGRLADAYTAMLRYRQDYGDDGAETARLLGGILLQQRQPREAALVLAPYAKDPHARLLQLLAELRGETTSAGRILAQSLSLARETKQDELRVLAWAVSVEAARAAGDLPSVANGLEHVLAGQARHPLPPGLFKLTGESLWEAYVAYATALGNRAGRLVGDDEAWLAAAREAERQYPVHARALTALVASQGASAASRAKAHAYLQTQLLVRKEGKVVFHALYLDAARFGPTHGDTQRLPPSVRHTLIDHALDANDLALASRLSAHAQAPPAGVDAFMWHLRRARILMAGGELAAGAEALRELVDAHQQWDKTQLERTLQVVFDLQGAAEHEAAIALFESLYARAQDAQVRREIHYWTADSKLALERPADAALLYMRSVAGQMDPWGQTAMYQAAGALARAQLVEDARAVYQRLLRVTEDPARRAVLQRELQQLPAGAE